MRHHTIFYIAIIAILLLVGLSLTVLAEAENRVEAGPGLLLIAHGSPRQEWNESLEKLGDKVKEMNKESRRFHSVELSFLECPQQDIAGGVEKLEKAGCDCIIVVPLFITPSSHTHFDMTGALGILSGDKIRAALEEEGVSAAKPSVPVTMTQTLDDGDLLDNFALEQVKTLSTDSENEAVVILIHGDADHHRLLERVARRVTTYFCGKTGITYADWAYCGVGQTYSENGVPAILAAVDKEKKVIVAGLYLSISAESLHRRGMALSPWGKEYDPFAEESNIIFSTERLVDNSHLSLWIMRTAEKALN